MLDERDGLHEHPGGARRHLNGSESPLPLQHNPCSAAEIKGTRRPTGIRSLEDHFASI